MATAALLLGGCAVGRGGGDQQEPTALREDLAVRPQPLSSEAGMGAPTPPVPTPAAGPDGANTSTSARSSAQSSTSTTVRSSGSGVSPSPSTYRSRAVVDDGEGDADGPAPPYGDVVALRLDDDGTRARFTVEVAGDVPARPAAGEQVAVGVDLWRGGSESEYQVYARGNDEGWLAWLATPDGFVPYPGAFELGGAMLVFTVPWSALGGRRAGSLSVLVEWEMDKAVVLAATAADRAPDGRATQPFSL